VTTVVRERRRHPELRRLVDELLAALRATVGEELTTDAARVDAAAQLATIMARVQEEAARPASRAD
jgi:hypothetical protein